MLRLVSRALLSAQLLTAALAAGDNSSPLYKDPSAPVEDRVQDLLQRMTIKDKMAQLMQGMP